jgi:enamine deaminase RidA (YjgF/YER057c/UK114 family)
MKRLLTVCVLMSLSAVACKKKSEQKAPEAAMPVAPAAPTTPAATPAAPAAAPAAAADGMMGVPECDDLIKRYMACTKIPDSAKQAFSTGVATWKQTLATGGEAAKGAITEQCKQAATSIDASIKAAGC